MNNTFGNVLLVIILVLLVGLGVWYFTMREAAPEPSTGPSVEIELPGGDVQGAHTEEKG